MGNEREAIEEANLKLAGAVRKGDAKELAALYTGDASLLPPNSGMVKGRKAIEQFWGGAISGLGLKDVELKTIEVVGEGDTVAEVGEYVMRIEPKGQKPMEDRGKYTVVWMRTAEGWKLHRDIWNTSLPAS